MHRLNRRQLLLLLAAFVLLLVVAYLGISLFVAVRLTAPANSPVEPPPQSVGLQAREIGFEATDGTHLEAWWARGEDPARAVVLVHGWGGNRSDEYVLETAEVYADAGYAALMLDLRGHGGSQEVRRTLGDRESRDVAAALSWLESRGFEAEETVLHGFSMGAATVVESAPGTGVAAVVEEAGYADLPLLLEGEIPARSGLPGFFTPGVFLASDLFLGLDAGEVVPREKAATLSEQDVPLFIIHSTTDEVVPYEHAKLFRRAYPEAEMWRLEGYEHVEAYTHPRYEEQLTGFLSESAPESG